jgi:hypothetical protein
VRRVRDETLVVGSEAEALIEANLIRRTAALQSAAGDKRHPYIKVTVKEPSRASS